MNNVKENAEKEGKHECGVDLTFPAPSRARFSKSPGNLLGPISTFLIFFFADYTVITDMVLGQYFD